MIRALITLILLTGVMQAAEITVTVTGVRNNNGVVAALLFSNDKGFPDAVKSAAHQSQTPSKPGTVVLKFKNVPAGRYAIAILHDEDKNGKLATNIVGIPREGVGISNGIGNSKPKFEKAVIDVKPGDNFTIPLKYW